MSFIGRALGYLLYNVKGHDDKVVVNFDDIKDVDDLIELTSSEFVNEGELPFDSTSYDKDISPSFQIKLKQEIPEVASIVFICQDPDAPLWFAPTHLIAYDIDPQGITFDKGELNKPSSKAKYGTSVRGRIGFKGAQPPPGHGDHRYIFQAFGINEGATKKLRQLPEHPKMEAVVEIIRGNILAKGTLIGLFGKK